MKPDITNRLNDILIEARERGTIYPLYLDLNNFNKKEIKYLNKKAEEMKIEIYWYDSIDDYV